MNPGGMVVFHPRKNTHFIEMESQAGDSKENGRETPPEILETLPFLGTPPPDPGDGATRPLEAIFRRPPRTESGIGAPPLARYTEGCCLA